MSVSMAAGHSNDKTHSPGSADLLLEVEVVEPRRQADGVAGLREQHGALQIGKSRRRGPAVIGIFARPDIDEPVHGGSERRMLRPVKG